MHSGNVLARIIIRTVTVVQWMVLLLQNRQWLSISDRVINPIHLTISKPRLHTGRLKSKQLPHDRPRAMSLQMQGGPAGICASALRSSVIPVNSERSLAGSALKTSGFTGLATSGCCAQSVKAHSLFCSSLSATAMASIACCIGLSRTLRPGNRGREVQTVSGVARHRSVKSRLTGIPSRRTVSPVLSHYDLCAFM